MEELNWLAGELTLLRHEIEKIEDPVQLSDRAQDLQARIAVARLYTEFLRANQTAWHTA